MPLAESTKHHGLLPRTIHPCLPGSTIASPLSYRSICILVLLLAFRAFRSGLRLRSTTLCLSLLVHLLEEAERCLLQSVNLLSDLVSGNGSITGLTLGGDFTQFTDQLGNLLLLVVVQLLGELLHGLLGLGTGGFGLVRFLDQGSSSLVGLGELLGIGNHLLDFRVGETRARGDGHGLVLVGGSVLGGNVHNSIRVDVKGDLDLRNTSGHGRQAGELEVTQKLVVSDELSFTLVDLDLNSGLTVGGGREDLGLLGRDGGVSVDESGEDTAQSLDTEGQRGDIEQQDVGDVTRQDTSLNGSTDSDGLVRVDTLGRVSAEQGLDGLNDSGHSAHTTDQDDVVDVVGLDTGVGKGLLTRLDGTVDERLDEGLELGPGHGQVDVLGSVGGGGDIRQGNVGLGGRRQLDLGSLSGLSDTLDSHSVLGQLDALGLLELGQQVIDDGNVKVFTTQVSVTVGGFDLENTLLHFQDGDIESSTSQIVNSDDGRVVLVQPVGQGGGGGLVDDSQDVQTSDGSGVLGGLTLGVVEVGGNGDNGVLDGLAQVGRGGLLHLVDNESTDLSGGVVLALSLDPSVTVFVGNNLVRDLVDVLLDLGVLELSSNQSIGEKWMSSK